MGPQNQTQTRGTINVDQPHYQTVSSRTTRAKEICGWIPGKRDHLEIKKPLYGVFLLYQKEEWETKASARLQTHQWMDYQELLPLTPHSPAHRSNRQCRTHHHSRHQIGIQYSEDSPFRLTQGSLCSQPRTLWANSDVLQTDQLTSNLPNDDGHNILWTNCMRNPHRLHGRYSDPHQMRN